MGRIRVCSWNINGIRSFRQTLTTIFEKLNSHIICLQETKSSRDLTHSLAIAEGYNGYFNHCCRSGYSGVALFCRDPIRPEYVTQGFLETITFSLKMDMMELDSFIEEASISRDTIKSIDAEGRLIAAFFPISHLGALHNSCTKESKDFIVVLSVYMPRWDGSSSERLLFRRLFESLLNHCILRLSRLCHVVVAGDYNTYHADIDSCEENIAQMDEVTPSRNWLDSLLIPSQRQPHLSSKHSEFPGQLVDVFRHRHPNRLSAFTCWSARTGARETNYGVRLDYILMAESLALVDGLQADHMTEHMGSDHCPVWADLPFDYEPSAPAPKYPLPETCSSFWPQCLKKQTELSSFLLHKTADVKDTSLWTSEKRKAMPSMVRGRGKCHQPLKQTKLLIADSTPKVRHTSEKCQDGCQQSASIPDEENCAEKLMEIVEAAEAEKAAKAALAWNRLLPGPQKAPLCQGHKEPCVLRSVKRVESSNCGRLFWVCARPQGSRSNPLARCGSFFWHDKQCK